MLILLAFAINSGYFAEGLSFMFTPSWDKLTWGSVLVALGQAFFTLSIGMGAIMAYGAYLPEETSITGASAAVVTAVMKAAQSPTSPPVPHPRARNLTAGWSTQGPP